MKSYNFVRYLNFRMRMFFNEFLNKIFYFYLNLRDNLMNLKILIKINQFRGKILS